MKKLLAMLLAVLLVFSLTACGNNSDAPDERVDAAGTVSSVDSDENTQEETEANAESEKKEEKSKIEESKPTEVSKPEEVSEESKSDSEWRQFLKDYEKWVDDYIAFMKKYKENPSDLTLLSEYSKMLTDMAEWAEKSGQN